MKTSTKRILSIALAGLFFVGILIVYASLIKPEVQQINEKRKVLIAKETLFNNESEAVKEVQNLLGQFQGFNELQQTVSLALPLEENITQVLNQIQSIARLSGINLASFSVRPLPFSVSKQPLVKRLGAMEVAVALSGSYEGVKSFLGSLETNVRLINVKNFRLSPILAPGALPGDNFNLTLTVETYHQ